MPRGLWKPMVILGKTIKAAELARGIGQEVPRQKVVFAYTCSSQPDLAQGDSIAWLHGGRD